MNDRAYIAQTAALLAARAVRANLDQASHVAAADALELHRIATRIHRADEERCNGSTRYDCQACHGDGWDCKACQGSGLSKAYRRREERARSIAERYGFRVYRQGDPRGCSLYLIPLETIPAGDFPDYVKYPSDKDRPPTVETLRARWIDANYNRGVAVCHLGR